MRHPAGLIPLFRPVNKRPVTIPSVQASDLSDQSPLIQVSPEIFQYSIYRSHMYPEKLSIPEIHHVIMKHQNVINSKAGN